MIQCGLLCCVYLFAASSANCSSIVEASPQHVPLFEEERKALPPGLAQCPGKDLILVLLLILLHGVGKVTGVIKDFISKFLRRDYTYYINDYKPLPMKLYLLLKIPL